MSNKPNWSYPALVYGTEGSTEASYVNCYTPK